MFSSFDTVETPPPPPSEKTFLTLEDLMRDLSQRMEKGGYKVVKARSHRGRLGGADTPGNDIVRCDLACKRGGRPYRCMATKLKTTTKKTNCPWKAKAVHRKSASAWVLTIICDEHNHDPGTPEPLSPTGEAEGDVESEMEDEDENDNEIHNDNGHDMELHDDADHGEETATSESMHFMMSSPVHS
jgi:hypothetical protein